jgi:hypothetical protein
VGAVRNLRGDGHKTRYTSIGDYSGQTYRVQYPVMAVSGVKTIL